MKIRNIVTVLLVALILASCSPAAKVVPSKTAIPTSTVTVIPPTPSPTFDPKIEKWSSFGTGWTNFSHHSELIRKGVFTADENLWVMKDSGVYYWDFQNMTARRYTLCDADDEIPKQIAMDLKENLWVLTENNIVGWNIKSEVCENITRAGSFPGDSISSEKGNQFTDLVVTDDGVVWIGNQKGDIFRYENGEWTKEEFQSGRFAYFQKMKSGRLIADVDGIRILKDNEWIKIREFEPWDKSFAEDGKGNIWMMLLPCCEAGTSSVFRFDGSDWIEVEEAKGGYYMQNDTKGNIWISLDQDENQGLWRYDGEDWENIVPERSGWIYLTANDDIWSIGFLNADLLKNGAWEYFAASAGFTIDGWSPYRFENPPNGALYLTSEESGKVVRLDGQFRTIIYQDDEGGSPGEDVTKLYAMKSYPDDPFFVSDHFLGETPVTDLVFGPDGDLWVGYYPGVARFDGKSWKYYQAPGLNYVNHMAFDETGTLWMECIHGISSLKDDLWKAEYNYPDTTNAGRSIVGLDGNFWSPDELLRFDLEQDSVGGKYFSTINDVSPVPFNRLFNDQEGVTWADTEKGVAWFDGSKWNLSLGIGAKEGISAIAIGSDNSIWVEIYGKNDRIMYFDGTQWYTYQRDKGEYLITASDGSAWLAKGTNAWISLPNSEALLCRANAECYSLQAKGQIDELAVAPDGALWITQRRDSQGQIIGLSRFMPDK